MNQENSLKTCTESLKVLKLKAKYLWITKYLKTKLYLKNKMSKKVFLVPTEKQQQGHFILHVFK